MNKIYHIKFNSDDEAARAVASERSIIEDAGGSLSLSLGMGSSPTILVLSLPDNISPTTLFPGREIIAQEENEDDCH